MEQTPYRVIDESGIVAQIDREEGRRVLVKLLVDPPGPRADLACVLLLLNETATSGSKG